MYLHHKIYHKYVTAEYLEPVLTADLFTPVITKY